jgi:hypothetical protein
MSIPDRLWRVVKGYWALAGDQVEDAEAQAAAYQELAETIRRPPVQGYALSPETPPAAPRERHERAGYDPQQASYELLQVEPGSAVPAIEAAYEARVAEIRPERFPADSSERAALEAKRAALEAAYERLRDAIDVSETRFERLEL